MNREILKVLKSLLFEFRLSQESWPGVIPLVQSALNHASLPSLGGLAPITVFTGLCGVRDEKRICRTSGTAITVYSAVRIALH